MISKYIGPCYKNVAKLYIFNVGIFVAKVATCHGYGYKPVFRHGYKPVFRIGFNSDTDADATQVVIVKQCLTITTNTAWRNRFLDIDSWTS